MKVNFPRMHAKMDNDDQITIENKLGRWARSSPEVTTATKGTNIVYLRMECIDRGKMQLLGVKYHHFLVYCLVI